MDSGEVLFFLFTSMVRFYVSTNVYPYNYIVFLFGSFAGFGVLRSRECIL